MKKTTWLLLAGAFFLLLAPRKAEASACTCARFHDWQDCGCNQNHPGVGGPPAPKSCSDCGMPRWWVDEPYVNLHISDTPLSYKMSSGKDMDFQLFYRIRPQVPLSDESPITTRTSPYDVHYSFGANCGTNAYWNNNWNMSVLIQATGNNVTPAFSQGYSALVFRPDGGVENYTNGVGTYAKNPSSQVTLKDVCGLGYPLVQETFAGTFTNQPTADTNGIFWGDPNVGVTLVYPDGSQDVFGLSAYPIYTVTYLYQVSGVPQMRLLLTQRISPQGRVTSLGYEYVTFTNWWSDHGTTYGKPDVTTPKYRLRYVVDEDGRTNTFVYNKHQPTNSFSISHGCFEDTSSFVASNVPARDIMQISEIDDPYGRKVQFGYDLVSGILTNITDAAGLTTCFQYKAAVVTMTNLLPDPQDLCQGGGTCQYFITGYGNSGGWITNMITLYGSTAFNYYEVDDPSETEGVQQRAIYVSEPTGAHQLYCYLHKGTPLLPTTAQSPTVPGVTDFDDGTGGTTHPTLDYRNTIYWGRRQFAALSTNVQSLLPSNMGNALTNLTAYDFRKGRVRNWLWQPDALSISECLSSERDPSPDAQGNVEALRTWYDYPGKPSPELEGASPQISCIARLLPDGTSQYTTYNYYPNTGFPYPPIGAGLVSDSETTYTKPDGTIGLLTNWISYANSVEVSSVRNSLGQSEQYGYDVSHDLTAITNALQQVTSFSWDTFDNLTGIQWPSGESVTLTRNYYGNWTNYLFPTSIGFLPTGRVFTNVSYFAGLPVSITDDRGVTTRNTWDGLNRLTSTSFPDGTSISNSYYRLDLVAAKDRLNKWAYYVYDGLQHLTTFTNRNNAVTTYDWCGCGSLTEIFDAQNGTHNPTFFNYDNQGNLTNVVFPDNRSLTYQFDLAGRATNVVDGANRALQIGYNIQNLPTSITSANGMLQRTIFDAVNHPIIVTDANGVAVTNTFDAINQLINRAWPDGISEGFGYSTNGLVAYTNRDGKATIYTRDGAGREIAELNANQELTRFAYDSLENLTSLWDGNTNQTRWQFNEYGWLTNKVDGLGRTNFTCAYNANGWLTNRWTPEKGNNVCSFDNIGNLLSVCYPERTNSYAYDALSRLTNMVDAAGTTAFSYTPAGQLQSENGPWPSDAISYTYCQGLRTNLSLTQPGGTWSQGYGFDMAWRLTNTVSPAGAFGYAYNANVGQSVPPASSLFGSIALPNGAKIVNSYDALARLTGTALNNYWGHTLDGYSYAPDPLGLRTNIVRNLGLTTNTVNVAYDNIAQVTAWHAQEASGAPRLNEQLAWAYDPAHNVHSRTNGNLSQTFISDAANQLTSVSRTGSFTMSGATPAPAASVLVNGLPAQTNGDFTFARTNLTLANSNNTFTIIAQNVYGTSATNTLSVNLPQNVALYFDNNGNLTNDGSRTFAYNSENELIKVTVANVFRKDFVFDGLNRLRIKREFTWTNSAWTETNEVHYIYDGDVIIQQRNSNNVPTLTLTRGLDLSGSCQGAGGIGGLLAMTDGSGANYFYHQDAVGSVTALIDSTENIVARREMDGFGRTLNLTGSKAGINPFWCFGQLYDESTRVAHFRNRDYPTDLMRWLNQDPIGERGGINLYRFVGNNPVDFVDPLGLTLVVSSKPFPGQNPADYGPYTLNIPDNTPNLIEYGSYSGILAANDPPLQSDDGILGFAAPELPIVGKAIGAAGRLLGDVAGDVLDALGLAKPKVKCPTATPRLLNAGANPDRNGLTKAGRALQKHGSRPGSVFPPASGNPTAINQQGQQVLQDILNSQSQFIEPNRFGGNDVFDLNTGQGVRFDSNGNMMGFLEPPK